MRPNRGSEGYAHLAAKNGSGGPRKRNARHRTQQLDRLDADASGVDVPNSNRLNSQEAAPYAPLQVRWTV